mmetsp:Transcript_13991/g.56766  ORF Transcript_13991/g.56766 Transcript_13991/m.56766 type:complete len:127 (+) Transcript_13991:737-1117(+)
MYLALSQEYLRLELAYLINFEQRRLFLGIRDKKDFVDKAKAVARAIMSSALLRHQGDRILYQQLIGIIKKPMDEYISNILHELSAIHDDVDGQNTQNDDSQNAGGDNLQFWATVVCSGDNINGTRC